MKLGVRSRLFAVSVAIIALAGLASALVLEREVRGGIERRIAADLLSIARTAKLVVEQSPESPTSAGGAAALAQALSRAAPVRVAIFVDDALEPGAAELLQARDTGSGAARRVGDDGHAHFFVAVGYQRADGAGILRLAASLDEVDAAVQRMLVMLIAAMLACVVFAAFMSSLASRFLAHALRELVESARAIAAGQGGKRLDVQSAEELGGIAGPFNRMAEELERTVKMLAGERNRFEATLESMSEAVLALDAEGRVSLVNNAALVLLRLSSSPIGRSLLEVVRAPALQELAQKAGAGRPDGAEFELPGPLPRTVLARATPLRATGGIVVVMHDVTELRRLETIRRDFVANVSHELRTPVSVIRANVETLLDGAMQDPEQARKFLDALLRNAERLSQLVADLLDISRIEAGAYRIEVAPLPLRPVMERAVESLRAAAGQRQQQLSIEAAPDLAAVADARALEQVLMNLVDNAVKYTPAGGNIVVRAQRRADSVRLSVEDDGFGIEPRHRARIFERFYRVDAGRSRGMGGTGLGLAIVKNLTEAMDGQAGVEAAAPHGSVFWVELPVA